MLNWGLYSMWMEFGLLADGWQGTRQGRRIHPCRRCYRISIQLHAYSSNELIKLDIEEEMQPRARFRLRYWVPHGHKLARSVKMNSQLCKLRDGNFLGLLMELLAEARLKPVPAFNHIMLDLFGPYMVRCEVQNRTSGKAYGVMFTDLAMRAVYIERCLDMTQVIPWWLSAGCKYPWMARENLQWSMFSTCGCREIAQGSLQKDWSQVISENLLAELINAGICSCR